ncbi:DUF3592 domain-containing protein [Emticicia sp. C21]|uniref:DUF3592 domain-containing protein n=1 Tax=Emticicia sp. C21 TaxID=2302915 RepID=UPI000E34D533|nr:DUF3592 domain-containing protein [Emticicia sp. C21]RFS18529.1 DUF3592 domain-containing protein [Emticicia sp. C21]
MIAALIFLVTGLGLIYITYKFFKLSLDFRKLRESGTKARGTITDVDITEGENGKTYFPIVQFRTYTGVEIIGKTLRGYKEKDYQSSLKEVEVIYLESNPKKFIIEGQKFDYWVLIIFIAMIISYPFMIKIMADQNPYWVNDFKQFFEKF